MERQKGPGARVSCGRGSQEGSIRGGLTSNIACSWQVTDKQVGAPAPAQTRGTVVSDSAPQGCPDEARNLWTAVT